MKPRPVIVTPTQYAAIEALARRGTLKTAAAHLDISIWALHHRLRKVRARTHLTNVQLTHYLGAGLVDVQDTIWADAA